MWQISSENCGLRVVRRSTFNLAHIDEQLRIIAKNAEHGRHRAYREKHSRNIDLFQHIEDEANRARIWLQEVRFDPTIRMEESP